MPAMEPWLRQNLLTKTGGFRAAHFAICTHCRQWTLTGLDDDQAAIQATVDPTPLTPAQEAECAIAGRRTYTLGRTAGGKPQIETRDIYGIAAPTKRTVVPAHRCQGPRYPNTPPPPPRNTTDECPF